MPRKKRNGGKTHVSPEKSKYLFFVYHSWYIVICFWFFFSPPGQYPYLTCVCPYVCSMTWVPLKQIIGNCLIDVFDHFDHNTQVISNLVPELCPLIEKWIILYFPYSNFFFPWSNIWNFYTMFSTTIHTESTSCFFYISH